MAAMPVASLAVTRGFGALRLGQNDKGRSGISLVRRRINTMDTERLEAQATQPTEPLEARRTRLAKNQALFRAVNDRIDYMARAQSAVLPLRVLCECADPDCDAHVELTQGEYEAVRQTPSQFFVLPAHVFPELETIVERRGHYVIVEKFGSPPQSHKRSTRRDRALPAFSRR